MWHCIESPIESWRIAVDCVVRHARSWSNIQGSTHNHENEEKTNHLRRMLYLVYAVLGVCCTQCMVYSVHAVLGVYSWLWHAEIERDDSTLYSGMTVELCTRKRLMGDDDEHDVENISGYEKSGVWHIWCGLGNRCIGVSLPLIGTHTCWIGDGKLFSAQNLLKSQFLLMITPISTHLNHSGTQLYHHPRTWSSVITLYLSMPWLAVNTKYSIHRVQHTHSTPCTVYGIHGVLYTLFTPSTQDGLSPAAGLSVISWQTMWYSITSIPTITTKPRNRVSAPVVPPFQTTLSILTATKHSSNLAWLYPPSASPNLIVHNFQMYLRTRTIMASKFARSQPPSAFPNLLNHGCEVYL